MGFSAFLLLFSLLSTFLQIFNIRLRLLTGTSALSLAFAFCKSVSVTDVRTILITRVATATRSRHGLMLISLQLFSAIDMTTAASQIERAFRRRSSFIQEQRREKRDPFEQLDEVEVDVVDVKPKPVSVFCWYTYLRHSHSYR